MDDLGWGAELGAAKTTKKGAAKGPRGVNDHPIFS